LIMRAGEVIGTLADVGVGATVGTFLNKYQYDVHPQLGGTAAGALMGALIGDVRVEAAAGAFGSWVVGYHDNSNINVTSDNSLFVGDPPAGVDPGWYQEMHVIPDQFVPQTEMRPLPLPWEGGLMPWEEPKKPEKNSGRKVILD